MKSPVVNPPLKDILMVEDSPLIVRMLRRMFVEQNYSFAVAENIAQAEENVAAGNFRSILCDRHLPDGDGIEFLSRLRATGNPAIPLLMTGIIDWDGAINAINRGQVFKFFVKPLDLSSLKAGIREAIETYRRENDRRVYVREVAAENELLHREVDIRDRQIEEKDVRLKSSDAAVKRQRNEIERLYAEIQKSYLQSIASLTLAIEAKDQYTHGHSERVYYYCSLIADILGLSETSRNDLRFAAVLHDIGKIGIPDSILRKEDKLSDNERKVIAQHPLLSESILNPLPFLTKVRKIVRQHHEKFDGTGYPDGLKGHEILLESRILTVADAFDAMRSDRPYRKSLEIDEALQILEQGSGSQFCPLCVRAFIRGISDRGDFFSKEDPLTQAHWLAGAFVDVQPPI